MIDSGASGSIGPISVQNQFNKSSFKSEIRKIGTAKRGQFVHSTGSIICPKPIGSLLVVPSASKTLLAVKNFSDNGITTIFHSAKDGGKCDLSFRGRVFQSIAPSANGLFYADLKHLCTDYARLQEELVLLGELDSRDLCKDYEHLDEELALIGEFDSSIASSKRKRSQKELKEMCKHVMFLHRCLGHVHFRMMATGIRDGAIVNSGLEYKDVMLASKYIQCVACLLAKWPKTLGKGSGIRPVHPFETISLDGLGVYQPLAIGGYSRAIIAVDTCVLFCIGQLIKVYNGEALITFLTKLIRFAKSFGFAVRRVRFDAGKIENCDKFSVFLALQGIEGCPTATEQQFQNPVERTFQTVKNSVAACLADQNNLSANYWGFAFLFAIAALNCHGNSLCPESSPNYEVMSLTTDVQKTANHYFGEKVVMARTGGKAPIGVTRNELGIVLGYGNLRCGSFLVHRCGKKFSVPVERGSLKSITDFDEDQLKLATGQRFMPTEDLQGVTEFKSRVNEVDNSIYNGADFADDLDKKKEPMTWSMPEDWVDIATARSQQVDKILEDTPIIEARQVWLSDNEASDDNDLKKVMSGTAASDVEEASSDEDEEDPQSVEPRVSFRIRRPPMRYRSDDQPVSTDTDSPKMSVDASASSDEEDEGVHYLEANFVTIDKEDFPLSTLMASVGKGVRRVIDPRNPTKGQALKGEDAAAWQAAMDKERDMLNKAGTWTGPPGRETEPYGFADLPPGVKAIPTSWILKTKDDDTKKARLVSNGNRDPYRGETYAPTASRCIMWLLFAMAVLLNLSTRVLDISGAFVTQDINRQVFVNIDGCIWLLLKYLYGLIDAPKGFNDGMSEHVRSGGYVQSKHDHCLFIKWKNWYTYIYILVHVDDFFCAATSEALIDEFESHLKTRYDITSKQFTSFLGVTITSLEDGSRIFTRSQQLKKIFAKWLPQGVKGIGPTTPMAKNYEQVRKGDFQACDTTEYLSLLGALQQLIDVRPDIMDAVGTAATFNHKCNTEDMKALIRIAKYLWVTQDLGLILRVGGKMTERHFVFLRGYADASYASMQDGRSKFAYSFDLIALEEGEDEPVPHNLAENTGHFHTKRKTGDTTALSSFDSEHTAVAEATKTAILFRGVLEEMHQKQFRPTPIFNDNKSTIQSANAYNGSHKNVRYMLPRINWMFEQVQAGTVKAMYHETKNLAPDMHTKPLEGPQFVTKRSINMGHRI